MAGELGERYEELNLVYVSDDQVDNFAKGQVALQTLVRNCCEYMDVAMAALILPSKGITLFHCNERNPLPGVHGCFPVLTGGLYAWMEANRESVVINAASDPLRPRACPGVHHKLLSCTVAEGDEGISGILVALNSDRKRDFSNSDRNLLEVMARKAAKVIQASYDSLTGLMNFHGFEWHLERGLSSARETGATHCVINIDLDRLQVVNDISGRKAGDAVLKRVAGAIRGQMRDEDTVARLGEDSFGILLEDCSLSQGTDIAERINRKISEIDFSWGGETHELSAGVGVAVITSRCESVADIVTAVELAQNAAKEQGRSRIQVFQESDEDLLKRRGAIQWVTRIQQALRDERLVLYAQSIQPLYQSPESFHYEILLRMLDDNGQLLSPEEFLPAAEHYFLMPAIDRWVTENTLATLAQALPALRGRNGVIAINLSGQSFTDDGFLDFVNAQLNRYPDLVSWLCFEVTESAAIANLAQAKAFISVLRERGCRFSLDDFGTGLSSFAYLKNLQVDYLKIDGSFVREMDQDPVSETMVSAINQVGHAMGLKTIAEYVNNDGIMAQLCEIGVDYGQGYGIAEPRVFSDQLRDLAATFENSDTVAAPRIA